VREVEEMKKKYYVGKERLGEKEEEFEQVIE
jgi:hypothetical protein